MILRLHYALIAIVISHRCSVVLFPEGDCVVPIGWKVRQQLSQEHIATESALLPMSRVLNQFCGLIIFCCRPLLSGKSKAFKLVRMEE